MRPEETETLTTLGVEQRDAPAAVEATAEPDDSPPGATLGRYVVLRPVGSGGMGAIFAAYDPELDRKVAIKVLRGPLGRAAGARREAQALARLNHPNVVTVHDVGSYAGHLYFAMEFIDGPTLAAWLEAEPRPWREVLARFLAAGRGLAAAHAAGLVHRDFKPSNVMLTPRGNVKVLDFGLARLEADRGELPGHAEAGATSDHLGTPGYIAPERLCGRPADARSDQFSFCAALYRALYGVLPYPAADAREYLERASQGTLSEPVGSSGVPAWLRKALKRGLAADPEQRFARMEDLLEAISAKRRRARRQPLLLAAAGALAAVVLGVVFLRSPSASVCGGGASRLAGIWDADRKAEICEVFLATGTPYAEDAWRGVEQTLDDYTAAWTTMYTEACEATHVLGEQSATMLDRRMTCLDCRLGELRALSEVFAAADPQIVANAVKATEQLTALADCADRAELSLLMAPPEDPETRATIRSVRVVAEDQMARLRAGQAASVAILEQAVATAEELGYPPLVAEALYALAEVQRKDAGDPAASEESLYRALAAAIAGGDRIRQVRICAAMVKVVGYDLARPAEARRWERLARSSLAALGPGHEALEYELEDACGLLSLSEGNEELAYSHWRRAFELAEKIWGPDDPRIADKLINLVVPRSGRPADSAPPEQLLERALEIQERAYGPQNPILARTLVNLGSIYADQSRWEPALAGALRALQLVAAGRGETHRNMAFPLVLTGEILNATDRPEEAETYLRRALPILEQGFGPKHLVIIEAHHALALSMLLRQRLTEARSHLDAAWSLADGVPLPPAFREVLLATTARVELAAGEPERSLALLREAVSENSPSEILVSLAETLLALGRGEEARPYLEEAQGRVRPEAQPMLDARIRFGLARILWPRQPDKARSLAREALQSLAGDNAVHQRLSAEIRAWLVRGDRSLPGRSD